MSDPRQRDGRWSAFEDELLRAGKDDAPPRSARRKTLIALGAGTGAALGSSAAGTSAAAGQAAGTVAGAASKFGLLFAAKWVGVGMIGAGTVGAALHFGSAARHAVGPAPVERPAVAGSSALSVERRPAAPLRARESAPSEVTSAAPEENPTPSEPVGVVGEPPPQNPAPALPPSRAEPVSQRAAEDAGRIVAIEATYPSPTELHALTAAVATPRDAVVESSAPVVSSEPPPALEPPAAVSPARLVRETALLEAARGALRARHQGAALEELDRYARSFPHGVLEPEAIVLRIEVQLTRGDRADAAALGKRFLEAFPRSPLAPRVRDLLAR